MQINNPELEGYSSRTRLPGAIHKEFDFDEAHNWKVCLAHLSAVRESGSRITRAAWSQKSIGCSGPLEEGADTVPLYSL